MGKKLDALLSDVQSQLQSGETIDAAALGMYETSFGGQKTRRRGALIATSQRVILHGKHLTRSTSESYPYQRIGSVETGKEMINGPWIRLHTTENTLDVKHILEGDAQAVTEHIRRHITAAQQTPAPQQAAPASSAADELTKLAALLQQGLITREHFDCERARLLG